MVNIPELRAAMARKEITQKKLAEAIGLSEQTMCRRMKEKCFGTEEAEKISKVLDLPDPVCIFFTRK